MGVKLNFIDVYTVLEFKLKFFFQPERIDPPDPSNPDYDVRADVWSLGISLVRRLSYIKSYLMTNSGV